MTARAVPHPAAAALASYLDAVHEALRGWGIAVTRCEISPGAALLRGEDLGMAYPAQFRRPDHDLGALTELLGNHGPTWRTPRPAAPS